MIIMIHAAVLDTSYVCFVVTSSETMCISIQRSNFKDSHGGVHFMSNGLILCGNHHGNWSNFHVLVSALSVSRLCLS